MSEFTLPDFRCDPLSRTTTYFSTKDIVTLDATLLEHLKKDWRRTGGTTRACLHQSPDSVLHEMVILQPHERFYPPKKSTKPKSFFVLEGELAVFTFNEDSTARQVHILGRGGPFFVRIEPDIYHCDISLTEYAIHLETISGPFLGRQEHIMAPWSPKLDDEDGLAKMLSHLTSLT